MPNGTVVLYKQPPKQQPKAANKLAKAAKSLAKAATAERKTHTKSGQSAPSGAVGRAIDSVVIEHEAEHAKAKELAKAMSCPNAYPPFRVQDGYSSFPTGASSPFMVIPASFSSTSGAADDTNGIRNDETWAMAFRDPRRSLMYYDGANRTFTYSGVTPEGDAVIESAQANVIIEVDYWTHTAGADRPHGQVLYTGEKTEDNRKWTQVTSSMVLQVTGLPASTATTCFITINEDGEDLVYYMTATSTAGGAAAWTFSGFRPWQHLTDGPPPNFFEFTDLNFNQIMANGSVLLTATATPVLCQLALADWADVEGVIEKLRFLGLNLMYSNTAAPLSRSGYCAVWQVPGNRSPFDIMMDGWEEFANEPDSERIEAKNGAWTFWASSDASDWEYLNVGSPDRGGPMKTSYQIESGSDYLCIGITGLTETASRAGYWSVFSAVQYRHQSVWHNTGFPDHSRRTFELALEYQMRLPRVRENPFHIKDIFTMIGQGARSLGNFVTKHKEKIRQTGGILNQITGGASLRFTDPAFKFMDTWF